MDCKERSVLILGGLGFIGSSLAIRLVEAGADVTVVDSMLPGYGGNLANIAPVRDRLRLNFSDIRDHYSLEYLVRGADVIYCVAGQISHIESMTDPMTDLDINCRSQLSILECCRQHNPKATLVYASTRQLYGRPQYLPVDENHPTVPVDVNGINKLAAENYYGLYAHVHGLRCVSLRLTNTYGPRQQLRGNSQGFTGVFFRLALAGDPIHLYGDGKQLRDFNFIDDVVDAFLLATDNPALSGQVLNLGAPTHYSLLEFVQTLRQFCEFEYDCVPFPSDRAAIDIGDYYADYTRFRDATGWEPRVELEEGIRRTVDYFRAHPGEY